MVTASLQDIKTDENGEPLVFVAIYLCGVFGEFDLQLFATYEAAEAWLKHHGHEPGEIECGDAAEINECEVRLA